VRKLFISSDCFFDMLFCIVGDFKTINRQLIMLALDNTPAVLIDPANFADIHRFKDFDILQYANLYVLEVDSLYRFIPTLKKLSKLARQFNTKNIFITSFTKLFNYDNPDEDRDVYVHAWEIISNTASDHDIYVAVEIDSIHQHLARLNDARIIDNNSGVTNDALSIDGKLFGGFMGHTLSSQRMQIDHLLGELQRFGNALDEHDRIIYNYLLQKPLKHLGSISYASPLRPEVFLLLSILLEQQKVINDHEMAYRRLQGAGKDSFVAQD
jgi:hypothetical protein